MTRVDFKIEPDKDAEGYKGFTARTKHDNTDFEAFGLTEDAALGALKRMVTQSIPDETTFVWMGG